MNLSDFPKGQWTAFFSIFIVLIGREPNPEIKIPTGSQVSCDGNRLRKSSEDAAAINLGTG